MPVNKGKAVWLAMRATYRRELEAKAVLAGKGIESFIPMRYQVSMKRRKKCRELVPVVHNLIFVRSTLPAIREVKLRLPYLQFMMDVRSDGREPIIVPDTDMNRFIAVSGTYNEQLIYLRPCEVNLSKGSRVRILGGEFEGQEGVFLKVKGARDRRLVVSIRGVIAVATATIHPDLVETINEPL